MSQLLQAQYLLNGSFEDATVECGINLTNQGFTDRMPGVIGFGEKGELDILSLPCGFGGPADGEHFVGLTAVAGVTDAIGLKISEPLQAWKNYTLKFYEKTGQVSGGPARLSIGFGTTATSHGELLHTVFNLGYEWTSHVVQFQPPTNVSFITVIVETGGEAWVFVDNFSLTCPEVDLGNDTVYCELPPGIILDAGKWFDNYQWSDQSSGQRLSLQEPGLFWVEATQGNCVVRDSIRILEDEFQCACNVFVPNAFSPDGDGVNETWQPLTPCQLSDYQLLVFNRWGGLVFQSANPEETWDGFLNGESQPGGTYVFQLRYRTPADASTLHQEQGILFLMR